MRAPSLQAAVIFSAVMVCSAALGCVWIASGSHRFVQINGAHGVVLDSRTGCVWRMAANPPAKVCPGDPAARAAENNGAALTPDEFMKSQ
jgi:hypothetical protein